jgi:N-acyl-D-amino-acid deacylase
MIPLKRSPSSACAPLALVLLLSGAGAASAADGSRPAVARALPLLQSSARVWVQKQSCSSCHHQALGLMATTLARERAFPVDRVLEAEQMEKTFRPTGDWHERYVSGEVSINEAVGQSYRAVGIGTAGAPPGARTAAISHLLLGRQHERGFWPSYARRPPLEDSHVTATALVIRTLKLYPLGGREAEIARRIANAKAWLGSERPTETEGRAMQLLGLAWAGAPPAELRALALALVAEQRPDGGWAQTATRPSDAYATGQVLVALNQAARVAPTDPAWQRGAAFLVRTQQSDGSWLVTTRRTWRDGLPYFESGFPHGKHQFISYAGTAWAVMALALAERDSVSPGLMGTPPRSGSAAPPAGPDGLTPLIRAALYGSVHDVERLIAAGADVNEATAGGMTPLMAAVHDAAKVRVLLAAGAEPSRVAPTGHTALQLAAAYSGAIESVRLLLARGIAVDVPVVRGNLRGVTPLACAVQRGDTATAMLLLDRGAAVDGVKPGQVGPLVAATFQGDSEMVEWLVARGAEVDTTVQDDFSNASTVLMVAAEDGRADVVNALLRRGAAVNHVDGSGLTALMYAAQAIDRGDTRVIDALLAAGADPRAQAPDGATPGQLAERLDLDTHAARLRRARSDVRAPEGSRPR